MQDHSESPTAANCPSPSSSLSEMRLCESTSEGSTSPPTIAPTTLHGTQYPDVVGCQTQSEMVFTLPALESIDQPQDEVALSVPVENAVPGDIPRLSSADGGCQLSGTSDAILCLAAPSSALSATADDIDTTKGLFPALTGTADAELPEEHREMGGEGAMESQPDDHMASEHPLGELSPQPVADSVLAFAGSSSSATSTDMLTTPKSLSLLPKDLPVVSSADTTSAASNGESTVSTISASDNGREVPKSAAKLERECMLPGDKKTGLATGELDESLTQYELKILGIPTNGIRTRVETQINLCLELMAPGDLPLFEKLHIDQSLVSKNSQMVEHGDVNNAAETRVWLSADVRCDSFPGKVVTVCDACQKRERKRLQRAKSRQTMDDDGSAPYKRPLVFNTRATVDFSTGNVILPTRITCYCSIHISLKDARGNVVAKAVTHLIMVTDDHKSSKKSKSLTKSAAKFNSDSADQLVVRSASTSTAPSTRRRSQQQTDTPKHGAADALDNVVMGQSHQGLLGGLRDTSAITYPTPGTHSILNTHTQPNAQQQARTHMQGQALTLSFGDTTTPCSSGHRHPTTCTSSRTHAHTLDNQLVMVPTCEANPGEEHNPGVSHTSVAHVTASNPYRERITKPPDAVGSRVDGYRTSSGLEGSFDAFNALCDSPSGALGMSLKQDDLRVDRIVPDNGMPGTMCAIVGATLDQSIAYIGFGQYMVEAKMINPNTILCAAPYHPPGSLILVDLFDKHGVNRTGGMPLLFKYNGTPEH